jgi:4-amino-4-deoxy-L-arabinose transferase-like glycosyltransferase
MLPETNQTCDRFKDPSHCFLLGILIFAFILRMIYFNINQAQWWDSALYLLEAKRIAFGILEAPMYEPHRPVVLPFLSAVLYRVGLTETSILLMILLFSLSAVYMTFLVGKTLYDREIGLLASFFMAVFWENLFYTQRILTEMPSLFFWLLTIYVYLRAIVKKEKPYVYFLLPSFVLMFLTQFRTGMLFFPLAFHCLVSRKWKILKTTEFAYSTAISLLIFIPYVIFSYHYYHRPLGFLQSYHLQHITAGVIDRLGVFIEYIYFFPQYLGFVLVSVFLYGTVSALLFAISKTSKDDKRKAVERLILLWGLIIFPLLTQSYFETFVDRYAIYVFPAVFLINAFGIVDIKRYLKRFNVSLARVFLVLILLSSSVYQVKVADKLIRMKKDSYLQIKEAGLWIKDHSQNEDLIISNSWPQIAYYAQRKTAPFTETEGEFEEMVAGTQPKYVMVSVFEQHPSWVHRSTKNYSVKWKEAGRISTGGTTVVIIYEYMGDIPKLSTTPLGYSGLPCRGFCPAVPLDLSKVSQERQTLCQYNCERLQNQSVSSRPQINVLRILQRDSAKKAYPIGALQ